MVTSAKRFSRRMTAAVLAVVALLAGLILFNRTVVAIPAGEAGALYRLFYGVQTTRVYRPGLHVIAPWNRLYHYETREQSLNHQVQVLSRRGLAITIALTVRYRPDPDNLGLLHQQIGPDYADRVVLPQIESVLRRELSRRSAAEIYTNEGGVLEDALRLARDEIGRNFVVADEIVIRRVRLPDGMRDAIEHKLAQRELLQSYAFRLETAQREADRLRTEGAGLRDYNALIDETLTPSFLTYEALRAQEKLATSPSTSVLLLGGPGLRGLAEAPVPAPSPDAEPPAPDVAGGTNADGARPARGGDDAAGPLPVRGGDGS